ncbi:MAG: CvpA family protein [Huintestinicola sp.]
MMPYILDIALLLILLCCIGAGYKRGVLKTVLYLVCFVIAFAAASALSSDKITEGIYDKYLHEKVCECIDSAVADAKAQAKDKVMEIVSESVSEKAEEFTGNTEFGSAAGDVVRNILEAADRYISENPVDSRTLSQIDIASLLTNERFSAKIKEITENCSKEITADINAQLPLGITVPEEKVTDFLLEEDTLRALLNDIAGDPEDSGSEGIAGYIERVVVRPTALRALGMIIWTVVFVVVNFILRIVVKVILLVRHISPIKAADSVLGAVLGAAEGAVIILALMLIVFLIIGFTGGFDYLNNDIISQTLVFGRLYEMFVRSGAASVLY